MNSTKEITFSESTHTTPQICRSIFKSGKDTPTSHDLTQKMAELINTIENPPSPFSGSKSMESTD